MAQVDVIYIEFSKAFDRVQHRILLHKLHLFNIPSNLINWTESYLSNRTQFVKFGNGVSKDFAVTFGVPLGSHLGPTHFILFINAIAHRMEHIHISLYADDVRLVTIIRSEFESTTLQHAIDNFKWWCDENLLHLNLRKNYIYGNQALKRVTEQRDYGQGNSCFVNRFCSDKICSVVWLPFFEAHRKQLKAF